MFNTSELYLVKSGKVYIIPDKWVVSGVISLGDLACQGYKNVHPQPCEVDFCWQDLGSGVFNKVVMGVWVNGCYCTYDTSQIVKGVLQFDNKFVKRTSRKGEQK